jgi:hypothetical protein
VFDNSVLGKVFGERRDEMVGGWRKLHNGVSYCRNKMLVYLSQLTRNWMLSAVVANTFLPNLPSVVYKCI